MTALLPLVNASSRQPAGEQAKLSLHAFHTRLIWLCLAPLIAVAAYLAIDNVRRTKADHDLQASNIARNFATAIDQHLLARIGALEMLAASPFVDDSSRWRDLYQEAHAFYKSFGSHVILADTEMRMQFNTRAPFGSKLPLLPRPKGHAAAPTALATGKPAVGNILFGPVAREPLVAIAVPVRKADKTTFIILSTFETRQFQERLDLVALPTGWSLTLLDGAKDVIARRVPAGLDPASDVDPSGRFVVTSAVSPWSVVLEIPRTTYRAPLLSAGASLLIAIVGGVLVSFLGGMLASRRLGVSVASLADKSLHETPSIIEIAEVRDLLEEAAAKREAAEAAQRESEQRFRATFEQAAVGIALVAPDGHWLRVNRKLCEIVGYSHAELLTQSFQNITHPDDLDTDLAYVQQMLTGKIATYSMEKRYLQKSGAIVWINLTVSLVRQPDGSPDYFISVIEDIQTRKQIEAALRESQERLQLFILHAPASLAMFDRDMRYLAVSRRWMDDYSLGQRDILGCSHYDVFPDIPERWREIHRRGLAGEVIRADEDRFERADGSMQWLRWEILPWHANDGQVGGIVIFSEDITYYKQAQEQILHLNASLEQRVMERTAELTAANRELDSFAYAVSHDLRAPLRAMSGFSQALQEDYGDKLEGEAKVYLQQIDIASRKMGDLIDGILTLSRSTRGELQRDTVDISALAAHLLEGLASGAPERGVEWQVVPDLTGVGDARMIEAVLGNLLGNAWKYTSRTARPAIRVFAGDIDGEPAFCVADNGAGFDMAHAERLFQPFQRLHRQDEFPGTGIGLATVQRIIHRHGGRICAKSQPGAGATFCFTLNGNAPKETP